MNLKVIRSLLVLSLALILVIGGTTMAWFTADYNIPSAAEMIVGNLEFEIADASVYSIEGDQLTEETGETIDWDAGDEKEFRWTFENIGSKKALFRARPEAVFAGIGKPLKDDSAWGEGTHFGGGNWAMYFQYDGGAKEVSLLAGQHHDAGTVRVWEEAGKLHVRYKTQGGWRLTETHLAIVKNKNDFPLNNGGNPKVGQLGNNRDHNMEQNFTYVLDLPSYSPAYLVAAHAKLVQGPEIVEDDCQITWSLPEGSAWKEGYDPSGNLDGWFYYCQPVASNDDVALKLIGRLPGDAENGTCTVELQAEAVQATHSAASAEWGTNNPCSSQ